MSRNGQRTKQGRHAKGKDDSGQTGERHHEKTPLAGIRNRDFCERFYLAAYLGWELFSGAANSRVLVMWLPRGASGEDGIGHGKSSMGKPVPLSLRCQPARFRLIAINPATPAPMPTNPSTLGSGTAAMLPDAAL
jgi:hypothetical protein